MHGKNHLLCLAEGECMAVCLKLYTRMSKKFGRRGMHDKIRSGKSDCKEVLVFVSDTELSYLCLNVAYICQVQGD